MSCSATGSSISAVRSLVVEVRIISAKAKLNQDSGSGGRGIREGSPLRRNYGVCEHLMTASSHKQHLMFCLSPATTSAEHYLNNWESRGEPDVSVAQNCHKASKNLPHKQSFHEVKVRISARVSAIHRLAALAFGVSPQSPRKSAIRSLQVVFIEILNTFNVSAPKLKRFCAEKLARLFLKLSSSVTASRR